MSTTLTALGIDRLSAEERLKLVHEIWESITPEVEVTPLTEAQKREIDRRLAAHRADPRSAIPWEQVEAAALARLHE